MYGTCLKGCDQAVVRRRKMEWLILRRFLREARKAGWLPHGISDGDKLTRLSPTITETEILTRCFQTDEETIYLKKGVGIGHIYCVYGNDGWDVISDYTSSLDAVYERTEHLINRLAAAGV